MRTLGLDLGTNSVGWALVTDCREGVCPDIACGVYVFPEAGELDDGLFESHRRKRGQKRRQRRNLAHKRQRRDQLVRLLRANAMYPDDEAERDRLYHQHVDSEDRPAHPYALRKRGLDERLSLHELGRALYHICRRRGYLSTALLRHKKLEDILAVDRATAEAVDRETGETSESQEEPRGAEAKERSQLKQRMAEVRAKITAGEARTLGEFYADRLSERIPVRGCGSERAKRNPERKDNLGLRAERQLFEDEFHRLWDAQARHYPRVLTPVLKGEIYNAIFSQRDLRAAGHLVGVCELLPGHKRAPRAALVSQRTILLQSLVNLRVQEEPGAPDRRLRPPEIARLLQALDDADALPWTEVRSIIGLQHARFSEEPETGPGRGKSKRARPGLKGNRTASALRRALEDAWIRLGADERDDLVNRLVTGRAFHSLVPALRRAFKFTDDQLFRLATAELPDGYMNHCSRVLRRIEPWLVQGHVYSEACERAGYRAANTSTEVLPDKPIDRLPRIDGLRNPMVERSVNAAVDVINAVIGAHGKPDRIRIEMPREVSKTNKQREEAWRRQDEQFRERERARKLLEDNDLPPTEDYIKKVRLWWEAGERCPYFPRETVTLQSLVWDYEIDHIVPRSRSYDDSWGNLTICSAHENQSRKAKQTPFEAYGPDALHWEEVAQYVPRLRGMAPRKRDRIICKEWNDEEFTNRALTDTQYASKVILQEVKKLGVQVQVSRGQLTALLRSAWELGGCLPQSEEEAQLTLKYRQTAVKKNPKPRFDHRHHALDAVLSALTDTSTLQRLTGYLKQREMGMQSGRVPKPKPWTTISEDLKVLLDCCFVVHAPTRGIMGALHKEQPYKRDEWRKLQPSIEEVREAVNKLPGTNTGMPRRCVQIRNMLVWFDESCRPLKGYPLESNHHAVIWESSSPDKKGLHRRDMEIVSMLEASRRAIRGEPVIRRQRDGWRYVMSLCKNDIIEWVGEEPGRMRVATFSAWSSGTKAIVLRPLIDARANSTTELRITSRAELDMIRRRFSLNPVGITVAYEPPEAE